MPDPQFTAQDLPLLNRLMAQNPSFAETANVVKAVTSKTKFPVNSYEDLTQALGGESAAITFGGRTMTLAQIKQFVPAYYFPISSEADLVAKIGEMQSRATTTVASRPAANVDLGVDIKWSAERAVVPATAPKAPTLTAAQIFEQIKDIPTQTGVLRRPD